MEIRFTKEIKRKKNQSNKLFQKSNSKLMKEKNMKANYTENNIRIGDYFKEIEDDFTDEYILVKSKYFKGRFKLLSLNYDNICYYDNSSSEEILKVLNEKFIKTSCGTGLLLKDCPKPLTKNDIFELFLEKFKYINRETIQSFTEISENNYQITFKTYKEPLVLKINFSEPDSKFTILP